MTDNNSEVKEEKKISLENCPEIMDAEQVAEIFHVSTRTIYALTKSGDINSFAIGKLRRYTKRSVFRYVYELTGDERYNLGKDISQPDFVFQREMKGESEASL